MKLINQLSKETGVPVATIRFYEKGGLFKGKKKPDVQSNNYTYYDDEVMEKLELIRDAKSVGFSLSEIKEVIDAWYSKRLSKEKKLSVLNQKLRQIDEKIAELKAVKKQIDAFKKDVERDNC